MNCRELEFDLDYIEIEDDYGKRENYIVTALYEVEGEKYLSLVSGTDRMDELGEESLEGHLLVYLEMEDEMFELMEIPEDEEFNRIASIIQEYEDAKK